MKVLNHDIVSLIRRMRRFEIELEKSVSSGISELSKFDLDRLASYIKTIKEFKGYSVAQPELDLPESSPLEIDLGEMNELKDVENDDIAFMLNLFRIFKIELVNSQSARRSAGLISHDSVRVDSYIQKLEDFISKFVEATNPLDLPESSPMVQSSGAGNTGI
jgi:hypothetical protein